MIKRDSNIELFRIFLMLMIIAHHYVVNSGLMPEIRESNEFSFNYMFALLWGWGGKVGIDCFLLITGYFMCKQEFSWKKLLRLVLEIKFYKLVIYILFLITGYESFSLTECYKAIFNISLGLGKGFTATYVCLYILSPYLNKWIFSLEKKEFAKLVLTMLTIFTVISTFIFNNYIEYLGWYITVYFIGAYIRLYPFKIFFNKVLMNRITILIVLMSFTSILCLGYINILVERNIPIYYFVNDENRILAILSAVAFFIVFKNIEMKSNRIINVCASATFGIFLIHANSDTMRHFLWTDILHNGDYFTSNYLWLHALLSLIAVYLVCLLIDLIRINVIEKPLFLFLDRKLFNKHLYK